MWLLVKCPCVPYRRIVSKVVGFIRFPVPWIFFISLRYLIFPAFFLHLWDRNLECYSCKLICSFTCKNVPLNNAFTYFDFLGRFLGRQRKTKTFIKAIRLTNESFNDNYQILHFFYSNKSQNRQTCNKKVYNSKMKFRILH